MSDMESVLEKRFATLCKRENEGSDACSKSLRAYSTTIHPMLYERLSHFSSSFSNYGQFVVGTTFDYTIGRVGLNGSRVMNLAFQPWYDQEVTEDCLPLIYPRLSSTTMVRDLDKSIPIDLYIKRRLEEMSHEKDYITLRSLLENELPSHIFQSLVQPPESSSLVHDVFSFLELTNKTFPSNVYPTITHRELVPDLVMKIKYYPSRDDNRAYCVDQNWLRHLTGCCIHSMFLPKDKSIRRRLHLSQILRVDNKDMLNIEVPIERGWDTSTILILGDVSNFTGSFGNAWLLLFSMYLELAGGRLEDRHQLFVFGDVILSCSWKLLLACYLFYTIGAPCWVEDRQKYDYLPGGFLGVAANITVGSWCFALILEDLIVQLRDAGVESLAQAGGDDFAMVMQALDVTRDKAIALVRSTVEAYIGKLKDFKIFILSDMEDGIIPDGTFCKKRIILRKTSMYELKSEPSLPIHESLLPQGYVGDFKGQLKAWMEVDASLRDYERRVNDHYALTDTLRFIFTSRYPQIKLIRRHTSRYWQSAIRLLTVEDILISEKAFDVINSMPTRVVHGRPVFWTFMSRRHHALKRCLVILATAYYGGSLSKLTDRKSVV